MDRRRTHPLTRRLAALLAGGAVLAGGLLAAPPAEAATVTGTATAKATIRSAAKSGATAVGTLERGQHIPTTKKAAGGWVQVRFAQRTAYVPAGQLTLATTGLPPAPTKLDLRTAKVATARLNVRSGPAVGRSLVGRIAEGAAVVPTGKVTGGYAEVTHAAKKRWVSVRHVASLAPAVTPAASKGGAAALAFAVQQLGKPYAYGASGPGAYDCSGLTSAAWKAAGVTLPRTSQQQFAVGTKVAQADLKPGDLVFFYGSKPTHVALYVGDGVILHAPRPGKTVEYSKLSYMPFSGARRVG